MQKWLLTIIIAILPVITACSKTDTEVSVPEEETRCVVKDELLPPPCSAWRIMAISKSFASSSVYCPVGRIMRRIFSAVESSGIG